MPLCCRRRGPLRLPTPVTCRTSSSPTHSPPPCWNSWRPDTETTSRSSDMRAWQFSENAYPYLPPADQYESIRINLPNRNYDPAQGSELYDRYIDEWLIAEDEGLEIMLNE